MEVSNQVPISHSPAHEHLDRNACQISQCLPVCSIASASQKSLVQIQHGFLECMLSSSPESDGTTFLMIIQAIEFGN